MKGISHFISGVAAATFVPPIVDMASAGSMVLLWAGVGGIMPDTLDFKLARYFETPDVEIDPNALDPQAMAEQTAAAINRAWETGQPVKVQFHTMKLGADLWRQYSVHFGQVDEKQRPEVRVRIGAVVTTSQVPYPGSELDLPVGRAPVVAPTRYTYDAATRVDIFNGPSFAFVRRGEAVEIEFLPWHRRWSHSLTLAALIGGVLALLAGPWAGLAYALGSAAHILEDQLGHMGSNLFYPFTQERTAGLKLFHSGDALPNLFAVWLSVALILFNLDRFSGQLAFDPWGYFGVGLALPWAVLFGLAWWQGRRKRPLPAGDVRIAEVAAEAEQIQN